MKEQVIQAKIELYSNLLNLPDTEMTENELDIMLLLAGDADIQKVLQDNLKSK